STANGTRRIRTAPPRLLPRGVRRAPSEERDTSSSGPAARRVAEDGGRIAKSSGKVPAGAHFGESSRRTLWEGLRCPETAGGPFSATESGPSRVRPSGV